MIRRVFVVTTPTFNDGSVVAGVQFHWRGNGGSWPVLWGLERLRVGDINERGQGLESSSSKLVSGLLGWTRL